MSPTGWRHGGPEKRKGHYLSYKVEVMLPVVMCSAFMTKKEGKKWRYSKPDFNSCRVRVFLLSLFGTNAFR